MPNKANCRAVHTLQIHSTRGWVYRLGEGWIFSELTSDELEEFRSYICGITIPRMKVRLPYGIPLPFLNENTERFINWFGYCTMPACHPQALTNFKIHQITGNKTQHRTQYPVEPGSYEAWLWAMRLTFVEG